MKVIFNTNVSGNEFYYLQGQVVELPATLAKDFIQAGFCEAVAEKKSAKAERATAKAPRKQTRSKK